MKLNWIIGIGLFWMGMPGEGSNKIRIGKGMRGSGPDTHIPAHARIWAKCLAGLLLFNPYNSPAKQIVPLPVS